MNKHHDISPSQIARVLACPGSVKMCRLAGPGSAPENEAATEGKLLHQLVAEMLANPVPPPAMNDEQAELVKFCVDAAQEIEAAESLPEHGMSLHDADGELLTYGTADLVVVDADGIGHVYDWKFGRVGAPHASENIQCRVYAAMLLQERQALVKVIVHLVQPRLEKHRRHTLVPVERDQLPGITATVENVIEDTNAEGLRLFPGDYCHFCDGKSVCPEAHYHTLALAELPEGDWQVTSKEMPRYLEACDLAEKAIEAIRHRARELLRAGEKIAGRELVKTAGKRTVKEADKAIAILQQNGITPFQCAKLTQVSIGDIEAAYKAAKGISKKEAVTEVANILGDLLDYGQPVERMVKTR